MDGRDVLGAWLACLLVAVLALTALGWSAPDGAAPAYARGSLVLEATLGAGPDDRDQWEATGSVPERRALAGVPLDAADGPERVRIDGRSEWHADDMAVTDGIMDGPARGPGTPACTVADKPGIAAVSAC